MPAPERGFEETIGTRWVVWVGGLTLALGGFFMVRYSIEAGLIGPGVRVMLGGAFALEIINDGVPGQPRSRSAGMGLRLAAFEALEQGGVVDFGRLPEDRWRVRLTVPQ